MKIAVGEKTISLKRGDITREESEGIVNAANNSLRGGGGVDGAIHRAGGSAILEECIKIGRCETGEAVVTTGGNLPARYVIHTVGPIWRGGSEGEERLLEKSYTNSLMRAKEKGLKSVSFPSISTGAYGYPVKKAAKTALKTIKTFLADEESSVEEVRMVLFDQATYEAYENALRELS